MSVSLSVCECVSVFVAGCACVYVLKYFALLLGGGAVCLPTLNINRSAFYLFAAPLWGMLGNMDARMYLRVFLRQCVYVCMLVSLSVSY